MPGLKLFSENDVYADFSDFSQAARRTIRIPLATVKAINFSASRRAMR